MAFSVLLYRPWFGDQEAGVAVAQVADDLRLINLMGREAEEALHSTAVAGCMVAWSSESPLCSQVPAALQSRGSLLNVVYLAPTADPIRLAEAFRSGASDVILWPTERNRLFGAVRFAVADSLQKLEARLRVSHARDKFGLLSLEECDVLRYMLMGAPNKRISRMLDVALCTVEARRKRICKILGTRSLPEIVTMLVCAHPELNASEVSIARLQGLLHARADALRASTTILSLPQPVDAA